MKHIFATLALSVMAVASVPSVKSVETALAKVNGVVAADYTQCWLECRNTGDSNREAECFNECIRR